MKKNYVSVVFDRRKRVCVTGEGKVEIHIYFSRNERKYIPIHTCSLLAWRKYQNSEELKREVVLYNQVVELMEKRGEDLTIENLNLHLGNFDVTPEEKEEQEKMDNPMGFINFMKERISKEKIAAATLARKEVVMDSLQRFGKLCKFSDLNERNVLAYDEFLHQEYPRSQPTIHSYHKIVKMYVRIAFQLGLILKNPYDAPLCHFERGKYKERRPLTEDELLIIRNVKLTKKEERVRDLFVFCAYTGLAYIDSQMFDFHTMTEVVDGTTYIDGTRVKTGNAFFTPILPPAMEVLEKYNYRLPQISNQKANDFLHLIESRCKINKPLTTHVARHSFATLCLAYDIPIENVARMMGHSNIRTTQVYARILKTTIERHTKALITKMR